MFNLIAAVDQKFGIGKDKGLPWKIKAEMDYFKKITTQDRYGNICIMGRNTWESIPEKYRPLQNRINIIISSQLNTYDLEEKYTQTTVVKDLSAALTLCNTYYNTYKIWIIGGENLYKESINHPQCKYIYLTKIYNKYECDKFFPTIHPKFKILTISKFNSENGIYFRFYVYKNTNIDSSNLWNNLEEEMYLDTLKNIIWSTIQIRFI